MLVLRLPHFLHAPTQNSKDLEKSTNIVAIPKPEKPLGDPKRYRPISLLCVSFKIFESFIYPRIDPIINPLLPRKQAEIRYGRSAIDQVTLMAQDIEDSSSDKKKAGAVFVDFIAIASYDSSWQHGLTCKLLQLLSVKHMVHMIMEMVSSHSFTLTQGCSGMGTRGNGVPTPLFGVGTRSHTFLH